MKGSCLSCVWIGWVIMRPNTLFILATNDMCTTLLTYKREIVVNTYMYETLKAEDVSQKYIGDTQRSLGTLCNLLQDKIFAMPLKKPCYCTPCSY